MRRKSDIFCRMTCLKKIDSLTFIEFFENKNVIIMSYNNDYFYLKNSK